MDASEEYRGDCVGGGGSRGWWDAYSDGLGLIDDILELE